MAVDRQASGAVPRIEQFRVENYRALQNLRLGKLTPLSVLLGPNGSGKSTLFDVFAFLSECFTVGLRHAWDRRGRFKELRTRGQEGPIVIELKYRETPQARVITYHLEIDERPLAGPSSLASGFDGRGRRARRAARSTSWTSPTAGGR